MSGPVGGLYEYSHGSDWTDVDAPVVADEFAATMSVQADFSAGTLSGCIGCTGDIRIERRHLYAYLGFRRRPVPAAPPTDYELHFGLTAIDPDGDVPERGRVRAAPRPHRHAVGRKLER